MLDWLGRYGGYVLIALGWVIFSIIIPSAAGPADVLSRERAAAPAAVSQAVSAGVPLLIGSPRSPGALPLLVAQPLAQSPAQPAEAPSTLDTALAAPADAVVDPLAAALPAPALSSTDRLVIPRIAVDTGVVEVGVLPNGEMETAAYAAGRLSFSAEAGEPGNLVLAGHNDVLGEVFRRLPELQIGDEIIVHRGAPAYRYRVEARTIVREDGATEAQRRENARWMDPTDEPVVTLISCYPYRVDTHRYIVRARLVE